MPAKGNKKSADVSASAPTPGAQVRPAFFTSFLKIQPFEGTALLALAAEPAWAQGPVSGTLTDGRGAALPGATITLPDVPGLGATTDAAGHFVLPAVPAGPHTLRASYVGFEATALPLQGQPGPQQLPALAL